MSDGNGDGRADDERRVEEVCLAFQRATQVIFRRRSRRHGESFEAVPRREIGHLAAHACRVLRTLRGKRTSLRSGARAFGEWSGDCAGRLASLLEGGAVGSDGHGDGNDHDAENERRELLRTWFRHFLRLRDGLNLLESGERRHPGDGDDDPNDKGSHYGPASRYPSRLSGALRPDGTTRKFSSKNGYTGAGYDELYDEDVGIKRRLVDALAELDGGGRSRGEMEGRLFDEGAGEAFEAAMDGIISEVKGLRDDLMSIVAKFVRDLNRSLDAARQRGGRVDKLTVVTDDKSERLTLGRLDIARQGDKFRISDAGGCLPFRMTERSWMEKFGRIKSKPQAAERAAASKKRNRRVIQDDSSDDEDAAFVKAPPASAQAKKKQPKTSGEVDGKDRGDDGLAVRVREATDVSRDGRDGAEEAAATASVREMKRRLGVDDARLERGHERMEGEQLRSTMAGDDEDAREALGGDGLGIGGGNGGALEIHTLVRDCLAARTEIGKTDLYEGDVELLRDSRERWADFDGSISRWKECFRALLGMRTDASLDESSDEAYTVRENFREANMSLGLDSMDVFTFFSSILEKGVRRSSSSTTSTPLEDSLAKVCHCYVRFAEETFKTALNLVLEQERHQARCDSANNIEKRWESGQHFLLRGRAHQNIGLALYEQAVRREGAPKKRWGPGSKGPKDLIVRARKEFYEAVLGARALRHNTPLIQGHANARESSTQGDGSWAAEGTRHSLEALVLESIASRLHIACSWKFGQSSEVEQRFDDFFDSIEISDVSDFAGMADVSHSAIARALEEAFWFAVGVVEASTQHLEQMLTKKGPILSNAGKESLRIVCKATKRAAAISDQLLSFVDRHSIEYDTENIATRASIEKEEKVICSWWKTEEANAQKKLSDVVRGDRMENIMLPRNDVVGEADMATCATHLPRKIFIQDCTSFQRRTLDGGSRRPAKQYVENDNIVKRFSSAFGSGHDAVLASDKATPTAETGRKCSTEFRKWGDEVLDEHSRCCPPLPKGLPDEIVRALQKKLGDVLPSRDPFAQ